MKKILTRLFIHQSDPTMYFMLDVLQKARDDYELRQNLKNLHETHKEKTIHEEDYQTYSDEGLQNLSSSLSRELHATSKSDPLHGELFDKYVAVCEEIDRRDIDDDNPFK